MAENRLAGVAYVTVDGRRYALVGELAYRPTQNTRDSLKGQDGVHGFKEMPQTGRISGTFRDGSGLSISQINAMTDVTVVAELANGKTIVGRNMWTVEDREVNTEEGTVPIAWEGADVSEN